jgi:DNA polymerase
MTANHNQDSADTKELLRKLRAGLVWQMQMGVDEVVGLNALEAFVPPEPVVADKKLVSKPTPQPTAVAAEVVPPGVLSPGVLPPSLPLPSGSLADRLDALQREVAAYEACGLKSFATNLVFGDGNPRAPVMLIGEAPGAEEDRLGKPFVGQSGQLLDKMLASIGITRESAYISNMIFWRPPGNRPPTDREIAQCLPFVERHIALIAPKFLVLVGGIAVKGILQRKEGITRLRGQWHDYRNPAFREDQPSVRALATYHPAFLMRSPGNKRESWLDMLKLKQALAEAD